MTALRNLLNQPIGPPEDTNIPLLQSTRRRQAQGMCPYCLAAAKSDSGAYLEITDLPIKTRQTMMAITSERVEVIWELPPLTGRRKGWVTRAKITSLPDLQTSIEWTLTALYDSRPHRCPGTIVQIDAKNPVDLSQENSALLLGTLRELWEYFKRHRVDGTVRIVGQTQGNMTTTTMHVVFGQRPMNTEGIELLAKMKLTPYGPTDEQRVPNERIQQVAPNAQQRPFLY